MCVCVCLSVCLSLAILALEKTKRYRSDTKSVSASSALNVMLGFSETTAFKSYGVKTSEKANMLIRPICLHWLTWTTSCTRRSRSPTMHSTPLVYRNSVTIYLKNYWCSLHNHSRNIYFDLHCSFQYNPLLAHGGEPNLRPTRGCFLSFSYSYDQHIWCDFFR